MTPFAHIGGIPVEETLLYAGPWLSLVGGMLVVRGFGAREAIGRLRTRLRPRFSPLRRRGS